VAALFGAADASGRRLELRGGGGKAGIGAAREAEIVDMTGLSGVIDYDPAELVLTVLAGTPLAQIEALLLEGGQMLAFDPFDYGPIFGRPAGASTIGGVIAGGVSGSRRVSRGAVRDHLLGFRAVSGQGEAFVAGAKVVKNVTGYDLPKLAAGSWGRLFALTEVTLKVLPRPQQIATLWVEGLAPREAVALMSAALGSQAEIAAAAHDPAARGRTAVRIEGFPPSVAARRTMIERLWMTAGTVTLAEPSEAQAFWDGLSACAPADESRLLWRINTPASRSIDFVDGLAAPDAIWRMDWGGALIWLATDADPQTVRSAASACGGHAQLLRAPEAIRRTTPVFHPQPRSVMALEARLQRAFDPNGVFETGRFLDQTDAD
jgi:glycolate oxidase FAD binding subunit